MSYQVGTNYTGYGPFPFAGAPSAGTSEVVTLTFAGTITGGTFTLSYDGYTTAAITWSSTNATLVANIDAALGALSSVSGAGNVTTAVGTMTSGVGTITVTFAGDLAALAVPNMAVATDALTGTDAEVTLEVTTAGVTATHRGAPKGALVTDTTNGILYINTGSAVAPTWTKVGTQS